MKILISFPGNTRTIPMSKFVPKAFEQLGHMVKIFNHEYDNLFERLLNKTRKKQFKEYKNRQLLKEIRRFKPDLFFAIYGIPHDAFTINEIKKLNIKTACWWLNDPFELPFAKTDSAPFYDFYFSNSRGTQPDYLKAGVKNIFFLPVGIDPEVHKFLNLPKVNDVVFAGDHHPVREKVMEELIARGFKIKVIGPWRKKIAQNSSILPFLEKQKYFTAEEMVKHFNESKVVLNIHTWYGRWDYGVNPRLFEASACKSFQLCDNKAEIGDFFKDGEDIVIYKNIEELPDLVEKYLKDENTRTKIAANAWNKAQQNTYKGRMKFVLETVFKA